MKHFDQVTHKVCKFNQANFNEEKLGIKMALARVFISFDYDHDAGLKELLAGQARLGDSPFAIADFSIKEASQDWLDQARRRIRTSDVVVVLCGRHTHKANGVAIELQLAREEKVPFFLLAGYSDGSVTLPEGASNEKLYEWTWPNLKILIGGKR